MKRVFVERTRSVSKRLHGGSGRSRGRWKGLERVIPLLFLLVSVWPSATWAGPGSFQADPALLKRWNAGRLDGKADGGVTIQAEPNDQLRLEVRLAPTTPLGGTSTAELWRPLVEPGAASGRDLRNQRLVFRVEVPSVARVMPGEKEERAPTIWLETLVRVRDGEHGFTEVGMAFEGPRGGGTAELSMALTPTTWQRSRWWAQDDRQVRISGRPVAPEDVVAIGLRLRAGGLEHGVQLTARLEAAAILPVQAAVPVPVADFQALSGTNALWGHPDPRLDKLGHWIGSTTDSTLGFSRHRPYLRRLFTDLRRSGYHLARVPLFYDFSGESVVRNERGIITGLADPELTRRDLQALLDEASAAGVLLVPFLVSFEIADGQGPESPQDFTDPEGRAAYISHVVLPIARQLAEPANASTVLALDLFNEPDGKLATGLPIGAFQAFVREVMPQLKALPGRPPRVTVGFQKLSNAARFGAQLGLDLLQVHSYQDGRFSDDFTLNLGELGLGASQGIPVVLWELGAAHGEAALKRLVKALHQSGYSGLAYYGDEKRFVVPPSAADALASLDATGEPSASAVLSGAWPALDSAPLEIPYWFPQVPGVIPTTLPDAPDTICVHLFNAELGTPTYGPPVPGRPDGRCEGVPSTADASLSFRGRILKPGLAEVDARSPFRWLLYERVDRPNLPVLDDRGDATQLTFPSLRVTAERVYELREGAFQCISWMERVVLAPDAQQAAAVETLSGLVGDSHRAIDALLLAADQYRRKGGGDSNLELEAGLPAGFLPFIRFVASMHESSATPDPLATGRFLMMWVPGIIAEARTVEELQHLTRAGTSLLDMIRQRQPGPFQLDTNKAAVGQLLNWSWQFARASNAPAMLQALDQLEASPVIQAELRLLSRQIPLPPLEQSIEETAQFLWGSALAVATGTQSLEDVEGPIRSAVQLLSNEEEAPALDVGLPPSVRWLGLTGLLLLLPALFGTLRTRLKSVPPTSSTAESPDLPERTAGHPGAGAEPSLEPHRTEEAARDPQPRDSQVRDPQARDPQGREPGPGDRQVGDSSAEKHGGEVLPIVSTRFSKGSVVS